MKACLEKIKAVDQHDEKGQGVEQMRALVKELKGFCEAGKANGCATCAQLLSVADNLVRKSVWVIGGDGWAYDIGYGGLDHVKNLGLMQMQYKNVYVAYVSMAANPAATVKAFNEAENYDGPAIIIAYAHCIEQGLNTATGPAHQVAAVDSVHFPLWRYDPRKAAEGKNGLTLDSKDKSDTRRERGLEGTRREPLPPAREDRRPRTGQGDA